MKLVMWIGGPEVVTSKNTPNYFECPNISLRDRKILIDTVEQEIPMDAQFIIPLEVEE